jgi:hypothetical protein
MSRCHYSPLLFLTPHEASRKGDRNTFSTAKNTTHIGYKNFAWYLSNFWRPCPSIGIVDLVGVRINGGHPLLREEFATIIVRWFRLYKTDNEVYLPCTFVQNQPTNQPTNQPNQRTYVTKQANDEIFPDVRCPK